MSKPIRIGTRDSELALWQAKTVQRQLEHLGHTTILVPVKSTGDLVLDKPIYELGITGVFTKSLDIAMLNGTIDIAVHSLKDVPTKMPNGIVQAAVLKRGNVRDCLVFKDNEEFVSQKEAIIATGSLRRRAQWLNRYPTHTIVDIRGNVNTRLETLEASNYNAAIFAAAGLGRIGLTPENSFNLDWMIPAPAQGAVMVAALEADEDIRNICAEINDQETEICTGIEREFLNRLEGGCSAPIGALAYIKDEEVNFQGVLLSLDGSKRIEVTKVAKLGEHHDMAKFCANYIIDRGGNRLMDAIKLTPKAANVFSTKNLTDEQQALFHEDVIADAADFIQINFNRINKNLLNPKPDNVIITSQNAVEALTTNFSAEELNFKNIYCVGRRTKRLVERRIGKVKHTEKNAEKLANYLTEFMDGTEITYFCSDQRMDDLPRILEEQMIKVTEIVAYETKLATAKVPDTVKGVMFYSPTGVKSYMQSNDAEGIAYCIGETTGTEAKRHFKDVRIAKIPTVESVIELVNEKFSL